MAGKCTEMQQMCVLSHSFRTSSGEQCSEDAQEQTFNYSSSKYRLIILRMHNLTHESWLSNIERSASVYCLSITSWRILWLLASTTQVESLELGTVALEAWRCCCSLEGAKLSSSAAERREAGVCWKHRVKALIGLRARVGTQVTR